MEAELHGQALPAPEIDPTTLITPSQRRHLHDIMDAKCSVLPKDIERKARAEVRSRVGRKFRVAKYEQITQGQFDEALNYLIGMELRTASLPESPKALPACPAADTLQDINMKQDRQARLNRQGILTS